MFPMNVEVAPEVSQQILTDRLALSGFQKLGPQGAELIVRDLDMDKIKQVRDRWAFYRDRRPDAYGELVEA